MSRVTAAVREHFSLVMASFVAAWKDPAQLFDAAHLAATRKRAVRFALTLFALNFSATGLALVVVGTAVSQTGAFLKMALVLSALGPLFATLALFAEALFLRVFGPRPVPRPDAWHLAVASVGFAQATLPLLVVPFLGIPLSLLLGARVIVSGMKKLGVQNGERAWLSALVALGLPFLLSLFVRLAVVEIYRVPTHSMYPSLQAGDVVLATKFDYGWPGLGSWFGQRPPGLGELVVVAAEDDKTLVIRRVVGLPGDRIEWHKNNLWRNAAAAEKVGVALPCDYPAFVNGRELRRPSLCQDERLGPVTYATSWEATPSGEPGPDQQVVVPAGQLLVLSDHRADQNADRNADRRPDQNADQRADRRLSPIRKERVLGRVRYVLWSVSPKGEFQQGRTLQKAK